MNAYFIVLDQGRFTGSRPVYELMYGNPDQAIGVSRATHSTIKALLRKVPHGETCYRVYLQRTDGKTGKKLMTV